MKTFIVLVAVCIASTCAASTGTTPVKFIYNKELGDKCITEVGLDPNHPDRDHYLAHDNKNKLPCIAGCMIRRNPAYPESKTLQEAIEKVVKAKESSHKELVDKVKAKIELCKAKVENECEYATCLDLNEQTLNKLSPLLD